MNSLIAATCLAVGAVATWAMLEVRGNPGKAMHVRALIMAHRVLGYSFALLFFFMLIVMIRKVGAYQEELSARVVMHATMGLAVAPILMLKILIVKRHRGFMAALPRLGKSIFLATFILVCLTGGYYFLHRADVRYLSLSESDTALLDENYGRALVQGKCGKCHTLERVFKARKDQGAWTRTINRMAAMDKPNISDADVKQIIHFLSRQQERRREALRPAPASEQDKRLVE